MKTGFFEKDITPPVGTYMVGYTRDKGCEGIADPLFLRVVALEDKAGEKAVLVTADILKFPADMSWRTKMWCARNMGLKSSAVLLNSSHTHCGPALSPSPMSIGVPINIDYVEKLEYSIREGIKSALNDLKPVKMRFGIHQSHFGINRRLPDPELGGKVRWLRPHEKGYYDPDLPVIAFYDKSRNKLQAVLYGYGCHPTSKAGYNISADYPGGISRGLKKELGKDVFTIFAQGAGGNVKPRFYDKEKKLFVSATPDEVNELGLKIAREISSFISSGDMQDLELKLGSAEKEFIIPCDAEKIPSQAEFLKLCDATNVDPADTSGDYAQKVRTWARIMHEKMRTNTLEKGVTMHLAKINLNEQVQIIGLSGEITAEIGKMIKDACRDKKIIFFGYCSYAGFYVPTSTMIDEGGYESLSSLYYTGKMPAPFVKDIDDIIKREVMELSV
ncbi:MAG: hypothetical protein ABIJ53_06210 [Verrucomicrobiota bacterium]